MCPDYALVQGHAEVDDSLEWEYDRNTRLVAPVGSPEGTFSSIVNVVGENGLEQGASLEVTRRMTQLASQTDLAWMNGDLSYARCLSRPCPGCCCNHTQDAVGVGLLLCQPDQSVPIWKVTSAMPGVDSVLSALRCTQRCGHS